MRAQPVPMLRVYCTRGHQWASWTSAVRLLVVNAQIGLFLPHKIVETLRRALGSGNVPGKSVLREVSLPWRRVQRDGSLRQNPDRPKQRLGCESARSAWHLVAVVDGSPFQYLRNISGRIPGVLLGHRVLRG